MSSGCADHKFVVNDMVNVLVEVQHVDDDFPMVVLPGRVAEVKTDRDGNTTLRLGINFVANYNRERTFEAWFNAKDFLNCDINNPDVFLRDYTERV